MAGALAGRRRNQDLNGVEAPFFQLVCGVPRAALVVRDRLPVWEFHPWVRKIPSRRAWQPSPGFLPGESHGQRSPAGCSPWGHRGSNTTERLGTHARVGGSCQVRVHGHPEPQVLPAVLRFGVPSPACMGLLTVVARGVPAWSAAWREELGQAWTLLLSGDFSCSGSQLYTGHGGLSERRWILGLGLQAEAIPVFPSLDNPAPAWRELCPSA